MSLTLLHANYAPPRVRRETLHGREYLVAPLTMIVHGVLNGSRGALYYPAEEIGKDPTIWNHVPIVVYHPEKDGRHVSARDPEILRNSGIGMVLKSRFNGKKLVADGWFDIEATKRVDERIYNALEAGMPIELSTGLFVDSFEAPPGSVFNGKPYSHIAKNYRADHLAVFADMTGACSVKDGCGVMVNTNVAESIPQWMRVMLYNASKKSAKGKGGSSGGRWVTIGGTHVLVDAKGNIKSGPKALKDLSKGRKEKAVEKHTSLTEKAGNDWGGKAPKKVPGKKWSKKSTEGIKEGLKDVKLGRSKAGHEQANRQRRAKGRGFTIGKDNINPRTGKADGKPGMKGGGSSDAKAKKAGFKDAADKKKFDSISKGQDRKERRQGKRDAKEATAAKKRMRSIEKSKKEGIPSTRHKATKAELKKSRESTKDLIEIRSAKKGPKGSKIPKPPRKGQGTGKFTKEQKAGMELAAKFRGQGAKALGGVGQPQRKAKTVKERLKDSARSTGRAIVGRAKEVVKKIKKKLTGNEFEEVMNEATANGANCGIGPNGFTGGNSCAKGKRGGKSKGGGGGSIAKTIASVKPGGSIVHTSKSGVRTEYNAIGSGANKSFVNKTLGDQIRAAGRKPKIDQISVSASDLASRLQKSGGSVSLGSTASRGSFMKSASERRKSDEAMQARLDAMKAKSVRNSWVGLIANSDGSRVSGPSSSPRKEPGMASIPEGKKLKAEVKERIVNDLISNCGCGCQGPWGEADRPALNAMPDEKLLTMDQCRKKMAAKATMAANATKPFKDANGTEFIYNSETGEWKPKTAEAKKEQVQNSAQARQTEEEWLKNAPPSVVNKLKILDELEQKEKAELITRLTANVSPDNKEKVAKRLESKTIQQLREDAELLGPVSNTRQAPQGGLPLFEGAAVAVGNSADYDLQSQVLEPMTVNWSEPIDAEDAKIMERRLALAK